MVANSTHANRLTVLREFIRVENGRNVPYCECRCECGNVKEIKRSFLRRSRVPVKSCGCLNSDCARKRFLTHGMSKSKRIYGIWRGMLNRCRNPNVKSYPDYGGRGIAVCERWMEFVPFYEDIMALPEMPEGATDIPPGMQIDRIDNDGNYEPGNVRLADRPTQTRNTRRNILIVIDGVAKVMMDWCRETGVPEPTASRRIRDGWDHAKAVTVLDDCRFKKNRALKEPAV